MKHILTISLLILFAACNNSEKSDKNESARLIMENDPNEITNHDTIYTKNMADNEDLLQSLKSQLKIDEFNIEERKSRGGFSYTNCEENSQVLIKGDGIRDYLVRSEKPKKGTNNYFPDFILLVYEFPTDEIAEKNFDLIMKARKSKGWRLCNGITVDKIVLYENEVFHLETRAEMFRTEIKKYGEMIKNFSKV